MSTVYDVPADLLIDQIAKKLSEEDEIKSPEWASFVKTGIHKERRPENPEWWFVRTAAIFRKVYVEGPVGVNNLKNKYGGKKDNGVDPEKFRKGSGAIIRGALHQLEAAGFIEKSEKGRVITAKGRSLLDNTSTNVKSDIPELSKY